jgi:prevent-host-death family protein
VQRSECIDIPSEKEYFGFVADTYTIKTAQQRFSAVVQEAADHPVTITKQGKAVAVMMSIERMEAIAETMEVLADPKAMAAIRAHREGRGVYHDVAELDDL